ncbi:MAG: hypothetical protein H5T86_07085, partial [Armatimonadetes bacterium]|nr:hypothetical protein [Armatimonadota bacterium]
MTATARSFVAAMAVSAALTVAGPLRADADRMAMVLDGVLRWADGSDELALFGVNYYVPFAEPYRRLKEMGLDHRRVIDGDVVHFARLGLTAIRLHVWDREISDSEGNLLDNEHLALLDYLIAQCKKQNIYTVLTPIAWWGSPEDTHGFSDRFPMQRMTTDP